MPAPASAEASPNAKLERELAAIAARVDGTVGLVAVHLERGIRVALNAGERFPMGSIYKLAIAGTLLARVDRGEERLDRTLLLRPADLRAGGYTNALYTRVGEQIPLSTLLELAITESDNTASDVLLREVGGPAAVTAWLQAHRIDGLRVDRPYAELGADVNGFTLPADQPWTLELFNRLRAAVPADARAAAIARFEADPRDTTSPDAMAELLVRLYRGELLSPGSTRLLLDVMHRTRTGDHRIRGRLPHGTEVADKTGTIARSCSDVGFITLPDGGGHLAVVVLIKGSRSSLPAKEAVIAELARALYDAFLPLSTPGPLPAGWSP